MKYISYVLHKIFLISVLPNPYPKNQKKKPQTLKEKGALHTNKSSNDDLKRATTTRPKVMVALNTRRTKESTTDVFYPQSANNYL